MKVPQNENRSCARRKLFNEFDRLDRVAFAKSSVVGVAAVAFHEVPGVDRPIDQGFCAVGDRCFNSFFFAAGNVEDRVTGAEEKVEFGAEGRHDCLGEGALGNRLLRKLAFEGFESSPSSIAFGWFVFLVDLDTATVGGAKFFVGEI